MASRRSSIRIAAPFELRLTLFGHGWIDLAPHTWDPRNQAFETTLTLEGQTVDVRVRPTKAGISLTVSGSRVADRHVQAARDAVRTMLRLDEPLDALWRLCAGDDRRRWVAKRGAGRLMRSATVFEDLMKLLFTTNCSWAATRLMTSRLVEALGTKGPSGRKAFPTATACATCDEQFYREIVRAGYRAHSCAELAEAAADGALAGFDDRDRDTDSVRRDLLALRGIGPYAAGQALRLLGHYDDLALDSWCRATLAKQAGRKTPPTDSAIARRYKRFGRWRGLVLWLDLTADWHDGADTPLTAQ